MIDSVATLVQRSPLFGVLDERDCKSIAAQMRAVSLPARTRLFCRDDPPDNLYLVIEGRVRLSVVSQEGRELSFRLAEAGDIFGEIALLDGGTRTADATTITRTRLMALARSSLDRLIAENPNIARATIRFLCSRLRETGLQLEEVVFHPIEMRLARFILRLLGPDTNYESSDPIMLPLDISQSELALLLGSGRQKVNEALGVLEARGAIRRLPGQLECCPRSLNRFADMA
jgi:CRP/FNR family transcriptional regulator, cyclic AMP receptor protein